MALPFLEPLRCAGSDPSMLLDGKNVVVTGAARGIGLAVARACLDHGARVLLTDSDGDALSGLTSLGRKAATQRIDVSDRDSVRTAIDSVSSWGRIDAVVNNAAVLDVGDVQSVSEERWKAVLDVNLSGALRVTQEALPLLRKAPHPAVVNTVAVQAFQGVPQSAAYSTSKGGLLMLTRAMAVDFGSEGIRVNAVAPGFIDTRMALSPDGLHQHRSDDFRTHYIEAGRIPLRRAGTPDDCAGAFVFLISDLSLYITGQTVVVDGGLSATY